MEQIYYQVSAFTKRTEHSNLHDITPRMLKSNVFYGTKQEMKGLSIGLLFGLLEKYKSPIIIVHQCDNLGNKRAYIWKVTKDDWRNYQD